MKVLVATVNYLLLVDLETHNVKVVESNRREYYGISWWENEDNLVLSHSGLANDSLIDLETYVQSEKGYLSFGGRNSAKFLSQPHQILCAPDDIVIATNTGRNCVSLYNYVNGFCKDIRVNDIYWDRLGLNNPCGEHFNSVFLKGNKLYILAHRFKRNSQVLVYSYPECILLEKYETKHRSGMHNIWVDDQENLFVCHSEAGELVEAKTNETVWASGSSHFTRGIAVNSDFIILGDSELSARTNRKELFSELWLIDRKTFKTLDYIPLGNYGGVHEVRLLDCADEAHHQVIFAGLEKLERTLAEKEEVGDERRQVKLQRCHDSMASQTLLKNLTCVLNGWMINQDWLAAKNNHLTLAILNEEIQPPSVISLDYSFPDNGHANPTLSLVFAYQGPADNNMIAVLLNFNPAHKIAALSLWANENGDWRSVELLIPVVNREGTLAVTLEQDRLIINCNDLPVIMKTFDPGRLQGEVGIRADGSQFKNLRFKPAQFWKNSFHKVKEIINNNI